MGGRIAGVQDGVIAGEEIKIAGCLRRCRNAGADHVSRRLDPERQERCAVESQDIPRVVVRENLPAVAEPYFRRDLGTVRRSQGLCRSNPDKGLQTVRRASRARQVETAGASFGKTAFGQMQELPPYCLALS